MKSKLLLKELARIVKSNEIKDDEFTVKDYIDEALRNGAVVTNDAARSKLSRMVITGELNRRKIVVNSSLISVYSFKKKPSSPLSNPRLDE